MSPAVAPLLSGALAFAGFGAVCAGMQRHGGRFAARPIGRALRGALGRVGFGLLALSALPCLLTLGAGLGLVTWVGALTAAALPIPLGLPYLPRPMPLLGTMLGLATAIGLVAAS